MATVVAVSGAGIEQRIPAEERRLVGVREQAHMAHGVARRVQNLELHGLAHLDDVAGAEPTRHSRDLVLRVLVRQDPGAGLLDHRVIAARVVAMLVRVEDLGDVPALLPGGLQALPVVEGIDRERLPGLGTDDQVIEIPVGVGGPDLFDDHGRIPVERSDGE